MKKLISILLYTLLALSCGEPEVVEWPKLTELDNLSIKLEHAAYAHAHDEQQQLLTTAGSMITQVANSVPTNAHNKEEAAVILADLKALGTQISSLATLDQDGLDAVSKALHPIVAKLMVTTGVPHIHAETHDSSTCTDPTHNH